MNYKDELNCKGVFCKQVFHIEYLHIFISLKINENSEFCNKFKYFDVDDDDDNDDDNNIIMIIIIM